MIDAGQLAEESPGLLALTLRDLEMIERAAAFRRRHREHARLRLRHADELLRLTEECRVRRFPLVPLQLFNEAVRFIACVDAQLRDDLGTDRRPDHVANVIFMAQGQLMHQAQVDRASLGLAPIIPLFGPHSTVAPGSA